MEDSYTYLWAFEVRPGRQDEFEQHYGRTGTWARLFRRSDGYLETLLLRDRSVPGRYVTVDRWRSKQAYLAFRAAHADEYARLDRTFEALTINERPLGEYSEEPA